LLAAGDDGDWTQGHFVLPGSIRVLWALLLRRQRKTGKA
jgi:hypothetical protein